MIDFDYVLTQIGGFGNVQIVLGFVIGYTAILSGFNTMSPVFINYTPDYRCNFPYLENSTEYNESQILDMTTPKKDNGEYDFCKQYSYNVTCASQADPGNVNSCIDSSTTTSCVSGYAFDDSVFPETVITEFGLVCDQVYLDSLATALYMAGVLIGSIFFGYLCDKFGRKLVMIGSSVLAVTCLFGSGFTHTYAWFVTMRVVLAAFGYGMFLSSFVYLIEICDNEYRHILGVGYQAMFAVGYMAISGLSYQWRNWHELVVVSGIFACPFALVMFFIPESPRWLFSVGKEKQGKKISRLYAKYNGNKLDEPQIWKDAYREEDKEEEKSASIGALFKTGPIRIMTFKSMFNWFVNGAVYYGISFNADSLEGSVFLNNTINGAVEIASYAFLILFMERLGRRIMLAGSLAIAGVSLLASTICINVGKGNDGVELAGLIFNFVAKFGAAASFAVIYNLTSELFPTVVRTNAVGISSVAGRFGSILAPLLLGLEAAVPWLPYTILGVLGVVGAGVSLSFPETTGVDMMETVEEAEKFYRGEEMSYINKAIQEDTSSIGEQNSEKNEEKKF